MQPTLTRHQQALLWETMFGAEVRALYFGELCERYQHWHRLLQWATLVASSGAVVALIAAVPPEWAWLRLVLATAAAGASLWSTVAGYTRQSSECSSLHLQWNRLAKDARQLWGDMYTTGAATMLQSIVERDVELGKQGTTFPNRPQRMRHWEREVRRTHPLLGAHAA